MPDFLQRLSEAPLIFDGAMGTLLYDRGVFVNTCYDEVNLTRPQLVAQIHQDYVAAGADVIETNSFGANRLKLRGFGLAEQTVEINRAAARLAREAAGEEGLVAGSVGPCLKSGQMLVEGIGEEIEAAFAEQIGALAESGVDCIALETFSNQEELFLAARVARRSGLPVLASIKVGMSGDTDLGAPVEQLVRKLDDCPDVDVLGINCGTGPAAALQSAERAIAARSKPFLVMPNAGVPQDVGGRMLYLTTPEYFTTYCMRYIELGARAVGGCCGTTPEHIREMAKAVRSQTGVKKHVEVRRIEVEETDRQIEVVPFADKCAFSAKLARGEKVTSVEILPPKSVVLDAMLEKCSKCKEQGIDAINIPDGPRASARVSPMIAAIAVEREVGIESVLHYCCRDRNLIGMQSDLLGGYAAGLRNYLIVTGDPPKLGDYPDATAVFDVNAVGLARVVHNLNHGRDIGGNPIDPPTGLLIGVGANPCAVDLEHEIRHYFNKLEAGAEYAITQPIFDPDALLRFLDRVEEHQIKIPVIAGVWPLVSYRNADFLRTEVPGVEVPDWVMDRMAEADTKEDGRRIGVEVAREIRDRIADRVAGFQVSAPFGIVDLAFQVLD